MDLALNNLQRSICHKTQQTNKQENICLMRETRPASKTPSMQHIKERFLLNLTKTLGLMYI